MPVRIDNKPALMVVSRLPTVEAGTAHHGKKNWVRCSSRSHISSDPFKGLNLFTL
jgi:hypothetical protein